MDFPTKFNEFNRKTGRIKPLGRMRAQIKADLEGKIYQVASSERQLCTSYQLGFAFWPGAVQGHLSFFILTIVNTLPCLSLRYLGWRHLPVWPHL